MKEYPPLKPYGQLIAGERISVSPCPFYEEFLMFDCESVLTKALEWAQAQYPSSSVYHKAAFANSVTYLVTGMSGGYGGPSLREHLVAWSLGRTEAAALPDGTAITVLVPGSLPRPGQWSFAEACRYAAKYCFAPAQEHLQTLLCIWEREYTFDNDPEDLEILRGHRS